MKGESLMSRLSLKNTNNLTVLEAFKDFKDKCSIKNLSKETIRLYESQFLTFHRFLNNDTLLISEITPKTVDNYILELRSDNHNCNDITINSYAKSFYCH